MRSLQLLLPLLAVVAVVASTQSTSTLQYMKTLQYRSNLRLTPFSILPQPNYAMVEGATVVIEQGGYASGMDQLFVDYQGDYDIRGTFDSAIGVLSLSGTAPISEYAVAISSVVFMTTAEDGATREITYTFGKNTFYMSSTRHFYEFVTPTATASNVLWEDALSACKARSYLTAGTTGGSNGYLATITGDSEMSSIGSVTQGRYWLGGMKSADNVWSWVAGPEGAENNGTGRPFWIGASQYMGGKLASATSFANWMRFQPDNGATNAGTSGEKFLQLTPSQEVGYAYFSDASNQGTVSGYVCEFGRPSEDTTMYSLYTDAVLLTLDCSLFNSSTECTNRADLGCVFNGVSCSNSACHMLNTQATCTSNWMCNWNTDSSLGACVTSSCSKFGTQDTCTAPDCTYRNDNGAVKCVTAKCSDLSGSAAACTSKSDCMWEGICVNQAVVDCNGFDTIYMLDGSMDMAEQFGKYTSGFFALTQMLIDADLGLMSSSAVAFGQRVGFVQYGGSKALLASSGGTLTSSRTQADNDLRWQQAAYSASLTTRDVKAGLAAALSMFNAAGGTRTRNLVIFSAGGIDDALSMATDATSPLASLKTLGVKIGGVAIRPTEPDTTNSLLARSSLLTMTSAVVDVTMADALTRAIYGVCSVTDGTVGQLMGATHQKNNCNDFMDRIACNKVETCSWDDADAVCGIAGCMVRNTGQTMCEADSSCRFDSTLKACIQKCPSYTDATSCTGGCTWDTTNNYCATASCVSNPDEDSCIADPAGCVFDPSKATPCTANVCPTYTDSTACLAAPTCTWSTTCFADTCGSLNQAGCFNAPQCTWTSSTATCGFNTCGALQGEVDCGKNARCQWNVAISPARCTPAPCLFVNASTTTGDAQGICLQDPQCYWQTQAENGNTDLCVVKTCEMNRLSCDCASMDGCVWRDGQCKTSTFVQCPAADLVFLVESTPKMSLSFGRHPNGFLGTVEAIRSWSRTAPLSPTSETTGFRLGLVGYGGSTTAMTAPTDIGAMGKLTGDVAAFADLNGEVDGFEAQLASYSANVGTDNGILNGIIEVQKRFASVTSTITRKKILVILGAQPITDGSDELGTKIAELETSGVRIFSNVLRRFSEISMSEDSAAASLRPLATDPSTTYFSFNTIETFQDSILNSFCDPSTNTGAALGISRDGTLPCDWLSGSTECGIQPSCVYNATALKTCPLAGQCPNLDCASLPDSLSSKFACKNCEIVSGVFKCSLSNTYNTPIGTCSVSPCMMGNCNNLTCDATSGCGWSFNSSRCERSMCSATTMAACNADLGCVWADATTDIQSGTGRPAGCSMSRCGKMRESTTCTNFIVGTSFRPCSYDETQSPAICKEARCASLDQTACTDPSMKAYCEWDSAAIGIKCIELKCQFTTNQMCEMDSNCYWNPFTKACKLRGSSCVLSSYSNYSAPTASCGANAIYYRARTILQFPETGGTSCADVAAGDGMPIVDTKMAATTIPGWNTDCNAHCGGLGTAKQCVDDISCEWNNKTCIPNGFTSCASLSTQAQCDASDMCGWDTDLTFCVARMKNCTQTTPQECATQSNCVWRVGTVPNALAATLGGSAQLVNPTQKRIFVFPNVLTDVANSDSIMINGATVTIEGNFQRGKDVLEIAFPAPVTSKFLPASGTLMITGTASLREYLEAIRFVTFFTSSMRQSGVSRTITWALGTSTVYSSTTQHYYTYHAETGVTWEDARAACANKALNGMTGYLVTVSSEAENDLISSKLGSDGAWISGDDYTAGVWSYSSGPNKGKAFWNGGSVTDGGFASPGMYANWNSLEAEPRSSTTTYRHPFLNMSGFWSTKSDDATDATGYICEYGGMESDSTSSVTYPTGGVSVVGISGCVPSTPCGIHTTMSGCEVDNECSWKNGMCVEGCNVRSTVSECQTSATGSCSWDVKIMPPVCDVNPCANQGQTACNGLAQCKWTDAGCAAQTGCAQYLIASECDAYESCIWSSTSTGGQCDTRSCETINTEDGCGRVPTCSWSATLGCTTVLCKFSEESLCSADSRCTWLSNSGSAAGFMASQGSSVFDTTTLQRPSDISTPIAGVLITISEGFQSGADVLTVEPKDTTQTWLSSYNPSTGVLSLTVAPGATSTPYDAFGFIQKNIKFYTSSRASVTRLVTYTLSAKTVYSSSTKGYLRNPPNVLARSRTEAAQACMSNTYMGFPGKLASITTQIDNMMLKSAGISGWIAAQSDGTSNAWNWGGSSANFWNGAGSLGTPFNGSYAQWAIGEPRAGGVAAVMTQTGTWRAYNADILSIGQPVICQYGDSTSSPQLIYGERAVKPIGCFATPCVTLGRSQCDQAASCVWNVDKCESDTFCQVARDPTNCNIRERCYWDYDIGTCRTAEKTFCSTIRTTACNDFAQCEWRDGIIQRDPPGRGGACGAPGCGINPVQSACEADSTCRWDVGSGSSTDGKCVTRLCGYRTPDQCWADSYCQYDYASNLCMKSECYGLASCSGRCQSVADNSQSGSQVCALRRCSAGTLSECQMDPACLFSDGSCQQPDCASHVEESDCAAQSKCYFTYEPIRCAVSQCTAHTDATTCTKSSSAIPECMWDNGKCRDLTWLERNAPETTGSCEKEEDPSLWWLWLLLAALIIVLALIVWRLYLAYAKNMSFFEPPRRNVKYSPHQQYAADLFEDAQEEAIETNHPEEPYEDNDAQERPSLNDL